MKVNYKSDFELTIQLTAGGVDIAAPSWDWQLRFYTFDRQAVYTVAHIDGKAERCAVNTDGTITAYFDKHGLMPGVLRCEFVNLVPDSHYTHDTQMQVDPVELGVELWRGASDGGMDAVTLELAGQVLAEVQALTADLQQKAESGYFDGEPGPQGPQGPPGPAGPGLLVVTVTGSDQEALTADHTAAEILAAHEAGRPVVAVYDGEVYQLASVGASLASFSLASADLEVLAQIDVNADGGAVRIFDEVQGALTAGDGITIDNNVISATGGSGSGIESIEQTVTSEESGGINVVTITMSDGSTTDFEIMNGKKGDKGDSGVDLGEVVLVNNLTDGGATSALSAEQGKVINSVLDINASSAEVSERIGYEQNNGYIRGQTPSTNNYYRYSDPILLKAGESLKMKAITPTNVWRLSSYNPTTQKYSKILSGESSGTSSAADAYENTYTATDDIYVVVCWYWNFYQLELTKTYNKTTTSSKIDDVDAIVDALDLESATETKTEDLTYTEKAGGFSGSAVGKDSTYNLGYIAYKCTEDFLLKQGDILQITAKNVGTNVSLLVTLDGTKYRTVILGNNSTQSETYTAPVDGYYAVTWNASQGVTLKVTITRTTTESERIATIEESTTQIPSIAESVADLEDAVFDNVNDDMTTDFVDGYFINHNGVPFPNSSFGYKEFIVKAGAVIQGQVYSHPNIAILAKKIDTGIYEELVAGTAQTFESFSYTAPENMTIAVTFAKDKDRSITINTDNVESNTINIDNILSGMDAINKRAETPDYGMFFDKVAVIGDSLTVGTLDGLTGGHAAGGSFNCSWLTYLAKKWGSTIRMHFGRGGSTCYDWIGNNDYGLGLMLKDSVVYDVYFVAYGHNDAGGFTIGTTSDTPTAVTVDADNNVSVDTPAASTTFLGNYKKIVNEIREKAPNALIFLVSTDKKDSTTAGAIGYMNQYIEELAEWYYAQGDHRVFYINYANKLNIANETAGYHTGGHFSTFGYAYVATIINECVNEVIYANLSSVEIKEWGKFIGAGYRTTEIDTTTSGGYLPHL